MPLLSATGEKEITPASGAAGPRDLGKLASGEFELAPACPGDHRSSRMIIYN